MSVLVALTPQPDLGAPAGPPGDAAEAGPLGQTPWKWVLSADGRQVTSQGQTPPALWPRADTLVLACPPQALGWVATDLPRVPAGRLKAALAGALEEALLDDPQDLHFALPPLAKPGRRCTVAVMNRARLQEALQAVEAAGREIDRVVPCFAPAPPGGPVRGHFQENGAEGPAPCHLVWADADGVACLPLQGEGARAWVQQALNKPAGQPSEGGASEAAGASRAATSATPKAPGPALTPASTPAAAQPQEVVWTTTPGAAGPAEAWTGRPLPVVAEAQPWLEAAASDWELRQFDLAPRHRGLRAGRDAWRRLMGPTWRPVRWGMAALLGVNVLGLQAWAWSQQQAVENRRQAQAALLKTTHPHLRVVLDAPLQMTREAERLREAAGQPGEADLEAALAAAAAAWPAGLAPAQALRYERAELTLTVSGITPAQVSAMNERLRPLGWSVDAAGGRLTMTRRAGPSGR
jgi:general secretion pathway protein L